MAAFRAVSHGVPRNLVNPEKLHARTAQPRTGNVAAPPAVRTGVAAPASAWSDSFEAAQRTRQVRDTGVDLMERSRSANPWNGVVDRKDRPKSRARMSLSYDSLKPGEKRLLQKSGLEWDRMSDHRKGTFKLLVRMLQRNGVKITDIDGLKVSFGRSSAQSNPDRAINMHFDFTRAAKREFERRVRVADDNGHLREGRSAKHGALGDKAVYRDVDAVDRNGHDMFGTQIGIGKGLRGFVDVDKYIGNGRGGAKKHGIYDNPHHPKYKPADPQLVGGLLGID